MSSAWKLARDRLVLDQHTISGSIPLEGRTPGLRRVSLALGKESARVAGPLLAVQSVQYASSAPAPVAVDPPPASTHRLRGNRVDLLLPQSAARPARLHLYWSASRRDSIDLEILADTTHNFAEFEVQTSSRMPATAARGTPPQLLVAVPRGRTDWVNVRDVAALGADQLVAPRDPLAAAMSIDGRSPFPGSFVLTPPWRRPIVCVRPAAARWSYIEMAHPDDCMRIVARADNRSLDWSFGLFGLDLEKGVILRGRLRAAVVPRADDLAHAQRLFQQFTREPPHLSV